MSDALQENTILTKSKSDLNYQNILTYIHIIVHGGSSEKIGKKIGIPLIFCCPLEMKNAYI